MPRKRRSNNKCSCGSGKKYKKCCAVKKIINLPQHTEISPTSLQQTIVREQLEKRMKNIKEPHCKICGDTKEDGKIMKIPTQNGVTYLCEFCYDVQINM